jgi:hypothetical protein
MYEIQEMVHGKHGIIWFSKRHIVKIKEFFPERVKYYQQPTGTYKRQDVV